jgi:hypothetical protein
MQWSTKDEVITGDVLESVIGGPTTIVEVDFEVETQDYDMDMASKASV